MKRFLFPLIIGLGGCAVLINLGIWQVNRLGEKEAYIASINAKIDADPVALPTAPDPEADKFLPVTVTGVFAAEGLRVLASKKQVGPGYRIITPFTTEAGQMILIDRGFAKIDAEVSHPGAETRTLVGNLHWPQESDSFTPAPDIDKNLWFAREVPAMAEALGTDPVLVVLRESFFDGSVTPMPVDTAAIPNDHLNYAITWFSLAAIWAGMTLLFLRRARIKES